MVTLPLRSFSIIALPILLFLILSYRSGIAFLRQNAHLFFFVLLFVFCGVFIFQSISFFDNAYQLPFVAYTALHIEFIWIIYNCFTFFPPAVFKKGIAVFFLAACLYLFFPFSKIHFLNKSLVVSDLLREGHSEKYINQINEIFSGINENEYGGFIYDELDIKNLYEGSRFSLVYQLGSYISYFKPDVRLLPLTPSSIIHDGFKSKIFYDKVLDFDNKLSFYKNYETANEGEYLKKFVAKNNIKFIVASKNFDIDKIRHLGIRTSFQDKGKGDQIIFLK